MLLSSTGINTLIFIGLASTAYPAYRYIKSRKKKTSCKHEINEVLMFSEVAASNLVQSKYSHSLIHRSTDRLLYYLELSQHTLDICMYMFTNPDIAKMLQKLHNRGIKIRVIVDADRACATGSVTKKLAMQGIEVQWMKSTCYMHHKFCLIDASTDNVDTTPFVMIGSMNWTSQATLGNFENVLVTSKIEIVQGLKEGFENIWVKFKPIDK